MSLKRLAAGVALTTLAALAAQGARAQSTASQVAEVIVTTTKPKPIGGVTVQSEVAKDQAIVTSQYIAAQLGSSNVAQLINMIPGVSYSTEDPTGLLSSDLRIHGFDAARISVTADGTPVNDTGNYAVYPGEYLPAEVTDRITVNMGGNEVDSPSASALGSTVNVVTKLPPMVMGAQASVSGGSYNYLRGYGEIDTGTFTPWGTRAFLSANYTHSDKYKGEGDLKRVGVDGRVYQPLRDTDFISVAGTYVSERSYFYESNSLAQYAQFGRSMDFNTQWAVPTITPGKADGIAGPSTPTAPGFVQGNDGSQGFWADHPNPVDFGDVRVQSRFDLSHGFTFTFDPYFFYTLANGGGATALKETDPRLAGNSGQKACVDLNGDGDCLDTVLVYTPSNTQTDRFGLNTSLLYDLDEHNHFQLSYTLDYGNHRQTGAYGLIDQQTGFPQTFFGGLDGQGINALDGSTIRKRDRFSVAELNQYSFNYIGRWFDNRLHVNIGVRDANFTRHLNQYCYLYNGGSEYCDTVDPASVMSAYNAGVTAHNATALSSLLGITVNYNSNSAAPNFRFPFKQTYDFDKALPNAGASWNFDPHNQVYVSYSEGFAAPKTDDLYTSTQELVQPETTDNYAGGYRYQAARLAVTASGWGSIWHNHIVQSIDPLDPTLSIDRNVGQVSLYGLDLDASWQPIDPLTLYAGLTLEHSQLDNNYTVAASGKPFILPVKGKQLVMAPNEMVTARAQYTIGSLVIGLDGKYTGERYVDDMNTPAARIAGFTTFDLDAEWTVPGTGGHTVLALNADNIFSTQYFTRSSTVGTAANVTSGGATLFGSSVFYYTGAPTTVYGALKLKF